MASRRQCMYMHGTVKHAVYLDVASCFRHHGVVQCLTHISIQSSDFSLTTFSERDLMLNWLQKV